MIEPFSDTWDMGFKFKKFSDDKFILAMIKHYELYTLIININTSNYLTKVAPTNNDDYFNAIDNCIQDIDYVSIAYISSDSFGVTCKNKNDEILFFIYFN